ncbi:hypothetical protein MKX07_008511 [Trichoderma sp. CBMAI-0711]|nr:hypothetical protein MKX07_008511 [Trichoderma sp. CBMAI-0711]
MSKRIAPPSVPQPGPSPRELVQIFYLVWPQPREVEEEEGCVRTPRVRHCSLWVSSHAKIRVGGGGFPGRAFNGLFASYEYRRARLGPSRVLWIETPAWGVAPGGCPARKRS